MVYWLRKVHLALFLFWNGFFFFLLFPFVYYLTRKPERYHSLNIVRKIWSRGVFFFSGILYSVQYEEDLPEDQAVVYCPNHASYLDIGASFLFAKGRFHFMGKDDLLNNFVLRIFFLTIDIPVNRESKISAFKAFKKASENIASGMSLIIFPEGKIPDDYPPVLSEFKVGAFRLAIEQQVPIVPVTFANNWRILHDDGKKMGSRPGKLRIFVHQSIPTKGLVVEDAEALKSKVFSILESKLAEYESR